MHRTLPAAAGRCAARVRITALLASLTLTISACGTTGSNPTGPATISGAITGIGSASTPTSGTTARDLSANSVPGEVIVTLADTHVSPVTLQHGGRTLRLVRPLGVPGTALYTDAGPVTLGTLHAAAPPVLHAEPNVRVHPLDVQAATTEDPLYNQQWALRATHTPAAWDVTTGDPGVTVAVLDSGILADPQHPERTHPDLIGRVLPGYDFISDAAMGNDGDGRDPDPYDSGSSTGPYPSWHGTHVAGIIGAATRDGAGMSGVAGDVRLLPVRVTGVGGGTLADLTDAVLWAVGLDVPGAPTNPNPASVLNLSLGAPSGCPSYLARALSLAERAGATVVAAAGNNDGSAASVAPANCPGVIAVAASGPTNERAAYSNHGSPVAITAPGGDFTHGTSGGVISLWRDGRDGNFTYARLQGTSMAAPHVAGTVALMRAVQRDLTPAATRSILTATATPITAQACKRDLATDCGAGLLHTERAVHAATGRSQLDISARSVQTGETRRTTAPLATTNWRYALSDLEPGEYDLSGYVDYDGNGLRSIDEPTSEPLRVRVTAGMHLTDANLTLTPSAP